MTPRTTTATGRHRLARMGALASALVIGSTLAPPISAPALAEVVEPGDLVIQEVYGGGGNTGAAFQNDFVELANVGEEDLSVEGWSIQYASASGTFAHRVALSGTVPAGETYLVQLAPGNGNGAALPEADATGGINASGSQGTIALSDASGALDCTGAACGSDPSVVDLVGYGGAQTFSGDAPAPGLSNATSASRIAATGENSTDFEVGAPTPTPSGTEEPTDPEPTDPEPTDPSPTDPAEAPLVTIPEIQGEGATSPLNGTSATTRGVVTAVYAEGGLDGFVIQEPGSGGALDPAAGTASNGLFVYSPDTVGEVAIGDSVEVVGDVSEFYGSTQISVRSGATTVLTEDLVPALPVTMESFPIDPAERESIEHMLYQPGTGDLTVTDVYETHRYGELGLAIGDAPLIQAGEKHAPGEQATALYEAELEKYLLLDDGRTTDFSRATGQPMSWLTTEEPVRVGAALDVQEPLVVSFGHDEWRLQPTTPWTSAATDGIDVQDTREAQPDAVGGDLQISTFNVLNYFTTLGEDTAGCTPYTDRDGGGTTVRGGCDLRGAWGQDDLQRQEDKITEAIIGTGAEVIGLTEIENSARLGETPDEATATLVAALNEREGSEEWAYVPTADAYAEQGLDGGSDVITNAIIYRKDAVTPQGGAQILAGSEAFDNAREPIGQVFVPTRADGEEGEEFFFVINHFKSKGSKDAEDANLPEDPVRGNASTSRAQQAEALKEWVQERRDSLDVDAVLFGGDLNMYTRETPMQGFQEAGYTSLGATYDPSGWSYSFGGMVGSLDHILGNEAASSRVTGATHWSINAPESPLAQYGRYNSNVVDLYEEGPFASSDHDPIIIGLSAGGAQQPTPSTCRFPGAIAADRGAPRGRPGGKEVPGRECPAEGRGDPHKRGAEGRRAADADRP